MSQVDTTDLTVTFTETGGTGDGVSTQPQQETVRFERLKVYKETRNAEESSSEFVVKFKQADEEFATEKAAIESRFLKIEAEDKGLQQKVKDLEAEIKTLKSFFEQQLQLEVGGIKQVLETLMKVHTQGTVQPVANFKPEADSDALRKAMKGLGTDEKVIIDIICYRSNAQRQELKIKYKSMFGRDLIDDIKSELSGDFEKTILGLLMTPVDYDAFSVKRAVKGLGTDEAALIEVLCTKSNEEMMAIKAAYKKLYKREMEKAVATDVSGDFKRLLVSLITANREPECAVDHAKASKDANDLYKAGEGKWGTDESEFNSILPVRSYSQLRCTFEEYAKLSKKTVEQAIKSEMSGDLERAYLAIVSCVRDPPSFFAERLYKSMKGLGTDEDTLSRVMVSRSELDLQDVKTRFKAMYGKTLFSFIKDDTSGDYEKTLLALCRD